MVAQKKPLNIADRREVKNLKKQLILLFGIVVLLLLLIAGAFWLNAYQPEPETSSVPSGANSYVTLLEKSAQDILSVTVQNKTMSFDIKKNGEQWTVDSLAGAPMNQSMLISTVNSLAYCSATVVTENPDNPADYGLDDTATTVEVAHNDGSLKLILGSTAPTEAGLYAKQPDSSTVYLLSSRGFFNLLNDPTAFIDMAVTGADISTEAAPFFETMTLGGSLRPEPLVLEQSPPNEYGMAQLKMISPKARTVKMDIVPDKLAAVLNIFAERVVEYNPDEAGLAGYGLDKPYSTVSFTYTDIEGSVQTCILSATKPKDGKSFVLRDAIPVVYEVSSEELPWLELTYPDLISSLLLLPNIMDVSSVTVTSGAKQWVYKLERSGEDLKVFADGTIVSTERFKKLYQTLIGLPAEQYSTEQPRDDAKLLMSITYRYHDESRQPDTVELLEGPVMQMYLSINGETEFLTKSKYLDVILANAENLPDKDKTMQELY